MLNQTLIFNFLVIQEPIITFIIALYTLDYLVSQLNYNLMNDWVVENHQNEHSLEITIYFVKITRDLEGGM